MTIKTIFTMGRELFSKSRRFDRKTMFLMESPLSCQDLFHKILKLSFLLLFKPTSHQFVSNQLQLHVNQYVIIIHARGRPVKLGGWWGWWGWYQWATVFGAGSIRGQVKYIYPGVQLRYFERKYNLYWKSQVSFVNVITSFCVLFSDV